MILKSLCEDFVVAFLSIKKIKTVSGNASKTKFNEINLKYSESSDKHNRTFQINFLVQFGKEADTGREEYRMILSKNYGNEI